MKIKDKKIIFWLLKIFIFWRLSLLFFGWIGTKILPFKHSFPYVKELLSPFGPSLFWSWANFDGVHYLGIAQKGYFAQYTQAFFPLYPTLIHYINFIFNNYLLTGLLISNLSFLGALYLLYKLIRIDFEEKIAKRTILFLTFFPTSFFFGALYTESFFLFLLIACFYCLRYQKWFLAGIISFFAVLTRLIGIFLVPAIMWEIYKSKKNKKNHLNSFRHSIKYFFGLFPIFGLLLYMQYLSKNFSDALYFLHAQPVFGASRTADKIILIYQVVYRYIKMIFTFRNDVFFYFTINLEFFSSMLFIVLLIFSLKKKIRTSYNLFSIFAYILPTLTGTFSSMPRYILVLFPCFMIFAFIKSNLVRNFLLISFYFLLFFCTALFTRGYWIA